MDFPNRKAALRSLCRKVGARFASEIDRDQVSPLKTGIPAIDALSPGGLPGNALSEIVEPVPSSGGNLLLHRLLSHARQRRGYAALVDGNDGFAPDTVEDSETLRHLYWVRCPGLKEAMQASDLIVADGNFSLLLIDLRRNDVDTLRRVPGNRWYRLQRAVRKASCTCVTFTPRILVPSAKLRFQLAKPFPLSALDQGQTFLCEQLSAEPLSGNRVELTG